MGAPQGVQLQRKTETKPRAPLAHGEAFCLMRYRNEATGRTEWLWNSRDGVSPFGINDHACSAEEHAAWRARADAAQADMPAYSQWLKDNPNPAAMLHEAWGEDAFVPNYIPPLGSRIFVSWPFVPDAMRRDFEKRWAERIATMPEEMRARARAEAPLGLKDGDPCVVVVDAEIFEGFHNLTSKNPFVPPKAPVIMTPANPGFRSPPIRRA